MSGVAVVAFVALSASPSLAQENLPDTLDWHGYFPLEVGNRWQYQGKSWESLFELEEWYEHWEIVGDTAIESKTYFTVVSTCRSVDVNEWYPFTPRCDKERKRRSFLRYEEDAANVLRWESAESDKGDVFSWGYDFRLDAPFYSRSDPGGWLYEYYDENAVNVSFERVETTVKWVLIHSIVPGSLAFAHGVGLARIGFDEMGGYEMKLVYADVGGRRYGRAVGLSVDRLAHSGNVRMDVYPNPAARSINVSFDLIAAGRVEVHVLDVIGRVVIRTEPRFRFAGRQAEAIALYGISSGVYRVVLKVDGEVAAMKPVVVIR